MVEPTFALDHTLPPQVFEHDRLAIGQAMLPVREDEHRVAPIGDRDEAVVRIDMRQHRHLGFVIDERALHVERVADRNAELDARIASAEGGQHFGDVIGADRADAQVADPQPLRIVEELARLLLLVEEPRRDGEEIAPGARHLAAPVAAVEQLDVELPLQGGDLRRQRRLADIQTLGARHEAAAARDGVKRAELRVSHRFFLSISAQKSICQSSVM